MLRSMVPSSVILEDFDNKLKVLNKDNQFTHVKVGNDYFQIRDKHSAMHSINTMRKSVENFAAHRIENGVGNAVRVDPVSTIYTSASDTYYKAGDPIVNSENFSNSIAGVGLANISTMVMYNAMHSYGLTYIALEQPMKANKDTVTFNKLVVGKNFKEYNKNEVAYDRRFATNPAVVAFSENIRTYEVLLAANSALVSSDLNATVTKGTVSLSMLDTTSGNTTWVVVAQDSVNNVNKDGLGVLAMNQSVADSITVNYETGKITVTNGKTAAATVSWKFKASSNQTGDATGATIPEFTSTIDTVPVEASPQQFAFYQNLSDITTLNTLFNSSFGNLEGKSYLSDTINQLFAFYVHSIDSYIMRQVVSPKLVEYLKKLYTDNIFFDVSGISAASSGNNNVLDNQIFQALSIVNSNMQTVSAQSVTSYIVDTPAAVMISTRPGFKSAPLASQGADGLIGFYNNIPVIRSRAIDLYVYGSAFNYDPSLVFTGLDAGKTVGIILGVHKNAENYAASLVYSDFISPWATNPVSTQFNTNIIRHDINVQNACTVVVPNYIQASLLVMDSRGATGGGYFG